MDKSLGIYIHVPFCTEKCSYCRFASFSMRNGKELNEYTLKLCSEVSRSEYKNIGIVDTIYFGGGTPALLGYNDLEKILTTIRDNFQVKGNIEISLEANPNNITKDNLLRRQKLGISRISIGVQTLNKESLIEIGRGNKGDIFEALNVINEFGNDIFSVSLDFIIGLPYVLQGEIRNNISSILEQFPFIKHISVYMLEDALNKWTKYSIKEEDYLREYIEIKEYLREKGFNRYELSNFASVGSESKHNKKYWLHKNYLGFGLGAHSYVGGVRFANSSTLEDYYLGKNIVQEILNEEDITLEKIMLSLRTTGIHKSLWKCISMDRVGEFEREGLLIKDDNKICLSDRGVLVLDYILRKIIGD